MRKLTGFLAVAALLGTMTASFAAEPCTFTAPTPLKAGSQAALSTSKYKGGDINIAYLPMGTEFNYHLALGEGIKDVVEATPGAKWFLLSPYSGSDLAGQIGMLQDVTARSDVDAIILISFDESALAPLVKQAVDAGKIVVIINSDNPAFPTPVHGVIGVKQRVVNSELAKWAIKQANGEPRKVGILDGEPSYLATERAGGFEDGIKDTPWTIVARVNGGWSVEKGNTAAMDLLQGHPDIQVLFASNDYMALGAKLAAKSINRNDVTVLGYDGDTGAIEDIAAGGMTATTNTSPVIMGREAACFVLALLKGQTEGGYVNTPTEIVTKDNAASILHNADNLFPKPSKSY